MVGKQLGGGIVFGGGLALYSDNDVVGGLGVSGDTSCADHNIAWRVLHAAVPSERNCPRRAASCLKQLT
jgi:uncharacterized protein GlcG (DUF336 family)